MVSAVFLLCLLPFVAQAFSPDTKYSVHWNQITNKYDILEGEGGVAQGFWEETRFKTGWDSLYLSTQARYPAAQQAYAVGYLEGALHQKLAWDAWRSWINGTKSSFPDKVKQFLVDNIKWVRSQVRLNPTHPYWVQVAYVLAQSDGLHAGYNEYAPEEQKMDEIDWYAFQAEPELSDIYSATGSDSSHLAKYFGSHCSGLIKLTKDNLFASHATWSSFTTMLRVYKFFKTPFAAVSDMQYPAYPGQIPSSDDYYTTSAKLLILETTNEILDNSLYRFVTPHTVPYWIRVTVASRLSQTAQEWVNNFAMYNSGTYNNQWMAVDYKLYTPGKPLQPHTLYVLEQIPGMVEVRDKTDVLNSTGYWASYNIPYYPEIYKISGYPAYYEKYGNSYSYTKCSRAQIFTRDHDKVTDLASMKHIMRYNEYQTDPLSLHDACKSISARCDLNSPWEPNTLNEYSPFGAIDCKISDHKMIARQASVAVSGPTWQSQPVFAWTEEWKYFPSFGQPKVFGFDWVEMSPK